jgi:hypothetical protein
LCQSPYDGYKYAGYLYTFPITKRHIVTRHSTFVPPALLADLGLDHLDHDVNPGTLVELGIVVALSVRHPIDRLVSLWMYLRRTNRLAREAKVSFPEFIETVYFSRGEQSWFDPADQYLVWSITTLMGYNNTSFSHTIHQETIEDDLKVLGISTARLARYNNSEERGDRTWRDFFYQLEPEVQHELASKTSFDAGYGYAKNYTEWMEKCV